MGVATANVDEVRESPFGSSLSWVACVSTAIVGVAVTLALTIITRHTYLDNQRRLLDLRARDAASVIIQAIPSTQAPLTLAATLAQASGGRASTFRTSIASSVGTTTQPFISVSLWRLSDLGAGPLITVGQAPDIRGSGADAAYLSSSAEHRTVTILPMLHAERPRLGYAVGVGPGSQYVVYGERLVPANRHSRFQSSTAFSGLDYGIYAGPHPTAANLIVTNSPTPLLLGATATAPIPYGQSHLTLVMSSATSLAGWLPRALPWVIAGLGALLTLAATLLVGFVTLRRRSAERLAGIFRASAGRNSRLLTEQRGIAQTLQQALLPTLPTLPGLLASARYEAGGAGVDVGGDWYDLIERSAGRVLMVVGDVSGQGLRAATTMGLLRHAIHAYAQLEDSAATILARLSQLLDVTESGQFATVLFAEIDIVTRQVQLTSAGHLPLLQLSAAGGEFLTAPTGLPVGVDRDTQYATVTVTVPEDATLVAYTDGLVERRGETLDVGLERLRALATRSTLPLPELLRTLTSELASGPIQDDAAIVGVQWTN